MPGWAKNPARRDQVQAERRRSNRLALQQFKGATIASERTRIEPVLMFAAFEVLPRFRRIEATICRPFSALLPYASHSNG